MLVTPEDRQKKLIRYGVTAHTTQEAPCYRYGIHVEQKLQV